MATVGPGQWVGEVAVLDPGPASATVRAGDRATVGGLTPPALARFRAAHPQAAGRLLRTLSKSLAARLRATARGHVEFEGDGPQWVSGRSAGSWLSGWFKTGRAS